MTYLKDVADVSRFEDFVKRGLIDFRPHPEDELTRVFTYAKRVQFEGIWTPETRLARGLILNFLTEGDYSTALIIGRGIPKFFTIEQTSSDWSATKLVDDDENVTVDEFPTIPWDAPAHIADKLNGALGLGYIDPNGNPAISTKGSFESVEATVGSRIILEKLGEDTRIFSEIIASNCTPLFEIITPERPHPIDYGDLEDLIYLGYVSNEDGAWTPADDGHRLVKFGFTRSETLPFETLRKAVEAPYQNNTEGMVATILEDGVQHLFKIKPDEYHALRKLFYSVRPKDLNDLMLKMTGEEISSLASADQVSLGAADAAFSGGHAKLAARHRNTIFEKINEAQELSRNASENFEKIKSETGGSRKEIALAIKNSDFDHSLLFALMKDNFEGTKVVYSTALRQIVNGK